MDAFVGEIRAFGFSYLPQGWLLCDGTQYSLQAYTQLFAVIGNLYGGDGRTYFNVPNLLSKAPMHGGTPDARWGWSTQLQPGTTMGQPAIALDWSNLGHNHIMNGGSASAAVSSPVGALPATLAAPSKQYPSYQTGNTANAQLAPQLLGNAGVANPTPHENRQPILSMNFCICYEGNWPPRP